MRHQKNKNPDTQVRNQKDYCSQGTLYLKYLVDLQIAIVCNNSRVVGDYSLSRIDKIHVIVEVFDGQN